MPIQEVMDPDVLRAFGLPAPPSSTPTPPASGQPSGPREVTDPDVLKAFGANDARKAPAEVLSGKEVGTYASFVAGLSSNDTETVRWLASQIYPDEPLDQAVKRFGKKDGDIYHIADDGQAYEALPHGLTLAHAARTAAKSVPFIAGTLVGAATAPAALAGPVGLVGSMAAAGGAAAATEAGRQALGDTLMGEASTGRMDPWSIAQEGAMNALGQGIGAGIGAVATRGAVRDIGRYDPKQTANAYQDASSVGVDITPAEATGLPTLAAQQKRLSNIPATADRMRDFYTRRNEQVVGVWQQMLDDISNAADAEDVGRLTRETADQVLEGMRSDLQAKAAPYYDRALAAQIPHTDTLHELVFRPAIKKAFQRGVEIAQNEGVSVQRLVESALKEEGAIPVPNMLGWQYVKKGLDDILGSSAAINKETGGFNSYGRAIAKLKSNLLSELDAVNPDYATARSIYEDGAGDVTNAMQSALGTLSRMKDTGILNAARATFDPKTRSPQMVVKLRTALEGQNPEAWQALKRLYMQDVTVDALRLTETGDVANPAGKLFKAFSNPKVAANLRAAMTPQEFDRMKSLLVVFRRASSVKTVGSDTAWNQIMEEEARKAARPASAKIVSLLENINPFQAIKNFEAWRTDANLERHAATMVDLIASGNPKAIQTMKELRRLSPNDKRWAVLFGQLISQSSSWGLSALAPEAETRPGQYAE